MMSYTPHIVDISGSLAEPIQRSSRYKSRKEGSNSRPDRNGLSQDKRTTLENPLLTRFPGDKYRSHRETALPPIGRHSGDPWLTASRGSGPLSTKHDPDSNGDSHLPRAIHRTEKQAQLLADLRNLDAQINDELRQLARNANIVEKIEYLRGVELVRANKVILDDALARGLVEETPGRKTSGQSRRSRAQRGVSSTQATGGSIEENSGHPRLSRAWRDVPSTQINGGSREDQKNIKHSRKSRAQRDVSCTQAADEYNEGLDTSGHSRRPRAQRDLSSIQITGVSIEGREDYGHSRQSRAQRDVNTTQTCVPSDDHNVLIFLHDADSPDPVSPDQFLAQQCLQTLSQGRPDDKAAPLQPRAPAGRVPHRRRPVRVKTMTEVEQTRLLDIMQVAPAPPTADKAGRRRRNARPAATVSREAEVANDDVNGFIKYF